MSYKLQTINPSLQARGNQSYKLRTINPSLQTRGSREFIIQSISNQMILTLLIVMVCSCSRHHGDICRELNPAFHNWSQMIKIIEEIKKEINRDINKLETESPDKKENLNTKRITQAIKAEDNKEGVSCSVILTSGFKLQKW